MTAAGKKCEPTDMVLRMAGPCEGELWVCAGYFLDGSHHYRCEKHARFAMRLNPAGPRYAPIKRVKKEKADKAPCRGADR